MNNWDNVNNENGEVNTTTDPYTSESSEAIYQTPDISGGLTEENMVVDGSAEEITDGSAAAADTKGLFSGNQQNNNSYGNNPYGNQQNNNPYDSNPYGNQQNNNAYGSNPYGSQQNNNPYGNNPYGSQQNNNAYDSNPYGSQQNNNAYGSNPYGNQQNNNPYDSNACGGQQNSNPYGGTPYGGQQNSNSYGGNTYAYNQGQNDGGNYNNQYSPYAVPQKKSNTGLIIAVIVVIIILFLVAVFALAYKAVDLMSDQNHKTGYNQDDYNFDDDYDYNYDDDYDYDYDDDYDYDYDDDYDYDNDKYYALHDDIKDNLSYSIDFDYYEYDTDYDNVSILVSYPVIKGKNVPNLDKLNEAIQDETSFFTEYFEEEYKEYIEKNEDSYFDAFSSGYVTYMDEDKISIVFSESLYSDYYDLAYLYCINIDMENGVVLDNEDMLSIDDDFSVDFRNRSDEQNGEISYLTTMTDQQITDYFNSPDVIVFYTPQGMEIGFNYEQGWVTVTYDEYEEYLKVF